MNTLKIALAASLMLLGSGCTLHRLDAGDSPSARGARADKPTNPAAARPLLDRAQVAERNGDVDAALVDYVEALRVQPDSADIRARIGALHERRGDLASARQAYEDALKIDPRSAPALQGLGLILLKSHQPDAARSVLQRAVAIDPSLWRAQVGLGVLSDLAQLPAQAQAHYRAAMQQRPNEPTLLNNFGYSLYLAGNYPAAAATFERALAINPDYAVAWSNLALARVRMGDYRGGVQAFNETMKPYQAYNNVGYLLYMKGDLGAARQYLQQAIALSPSYYALAQQNLERVEIASGTAQLMPTATRTTLAVSGSVR
jgi:Flp pilus assembly protein TadD